MQLLAPVGVTALATPAAHKPDVGGVAKLPPLDGPQAPFTGGVGAGVGVPATPQFELMSVAAPPLPSMGQKKNAVPLPPASLTCVDVPAAKVFGADEQPPHVAGV
jgi:hypothetical protein